MDTDGDHGLAAMVRACEPDEPIEERRVWAELQRRLFAGEAETVVRLDRYIVLERLGRGAAGVIYAAYDPRLDRKVAIKVLVGGPSHADVLREAQAVARVRHPHVVTVFDVGDDPLGRGVFMAMELVDGVDLHVWSQTPRPWRDVVEVFRRAGRGLAAAHESGIVHGDFKPANVLVGRGDDVKVTDFGLARPAAAAGDGRLAGTPIYMAPEQLEGNPGDARSDQYAFCVSLFEVLSGRVPFEADTAAALVHRKRIGRPPALQGVPRWLESVIVRGLDPVPSLRFPSMHALVRAIERGLARRRIVAEAIVVGTAIGVAVWLGLRPPDDPCTSAAARARQTLAHGWPAVQQAIASTELGYGPAIARSLERELGGYADAWQRASLAACNAGQGGHARAWAESQTCLDFRHLRLESLLDLLARGRASDVERAIEAVQALPSPGRCSEADVRAQGDGDAADRHALERRLAAAEALHSAGRDEDARPIVDEVLAVVGTRVDIRARALQQRARIELELGEVAPALATTTEAMTLAEAAGDVELVTALILDLAAITGRHAGRHDEARRLLAWARGRLDRRALDDDEDARWARESGILRSLEGDGRGAIADLEHALAISRERHGDDDVRTANAESELGNALHRLGRHHEAEARHARALAIRARLLGDTHPRVGASLINLGNAFAARGEHERALTAYARALAIYDASLREGHPDRAALRNNMAIALFDLGRWDEALREHRAALEIRTRALGERHVLVAMSELNVGAVLEAKGELELAEAHYRRALALRESLLGPDHPDVALVLNNLGSVAAKRGDFETSVRLHEQALAKRRRALGDDHPDAGRSWLNLGDAQLRVGEAELAADSLTRGIDVLARHPGLERHQLAWRHMRLAEAHRVAGHPEAAAEALRRGLEYATTHGLEAEQAALREVVHREGLRGPSPVPAKP